LGGRGRQISEFAANLVYKLSSRTAGAIQRNPVLKKKKQKTKKWGALWGKKNNSRNFYFQIYRRIETLFNINMHA
jgi:hypothetical protein